MRTLQTAEGPLSVMRRSPNGEMCEYAGGRYDISTFETHKNDNRLPEGYLSRLDVLWRKAAQKRIAQAAAFFVFGVAGLSACTNGEQAEHIAITTGTSNREARPTVATSQAPETRDPQCYSNFDSLEAASQEECRRLIAQMPMAEIDQLVPADQARWASYYRYVKLGEPTPIHQLIPAVYMEPNDVGDTVGDTANTLLFDHQETIYRAAWLLQNKPDVCADGRTLRALFGDVDVQSESFKAAQHIATNYPSAGKAIGDYAGSLHTTAPLFDSLTAQEATATRQGDAYRLRFTAHLKATGQGQIFAFNLFPYMGKIEREEGGFRESFQTYKTKEEEQIFGRLHRQLLVSTPNITS